MERFFNRMGQVGVSLLIGGVILSRFVFVVDGGERAVIFDRIRGVQTKVYGEGMHFIIPFLQVINTHPSPNFAHYRFQEFSKSEPDLR